MFLELCKNFLFCIFLTLLVKDFTQNCIYINTGEGGKAIVKFEAGEEKHLSFQPDFGNKRSVTCQRSHLEK